MMNRKAILSLGAVFAIAACGQSTADEKAEQTPAAASATIAAPSGAYETDYKHRYITFTYDHQGFSTPFLRWRDWSGELNWNADDPAASSVSVVIDAESIDSGVDEFDGHLRGADFFDVENHPEITFTSTSVSKTGENTGMITGDLTIKGITKSVTLDTTLNKAATGGRTGDKLGFSAKTTVKRSDFGVDAYVPHVGDDVTIIIETEWEKAD